MKDPKEHLIAWLKDAYAMEKQAIEILTRQADRIDNYPELTARLKQHLEETRWQASQIENCLEKLGSDTSSFKSGVGIVSANLKAMGTMFAPDEVIKDSMASTVFEHYEITNYKILIAAAEHAGEQEIANVCQQILQQEEAMADWLDEHIPETTMAFLARDSAGMEAKI